MADVIVNITKDVTEQAVIYNDAQYGMHSGKALNVWIAAYFESN